MAQRNEHRKHFLMAADLLKKVLAREISAEDALAAWPATADLQTPPLRNAWTRLRHFADDADLHEKDLGYFSAECKRLNDAITELMTAEPKG